MHVIDVAEIRFKRDKNIWTLVDVIGARNERRKWADHYGGVSAIFYVVNLSGYSKQLTEEPTMNRMQVLQHNVSL